MSATVSCRCGAKIRLPEGAAGRAFRCPRCKEELVATSVPQVVITAAPSAGSGEESCPICQTSIGAEAVLTCPECHQVHHRECWLEVGACGTYGCKHGPASNKEEAAEDVPRAAWGDTKKCPACGEKIKAIALRCRYCGTDFSTVDPLTVHDLHDEAENLAAQRGAQYTVIMLFVASIMGCAAPLLLIISLIWVLPRRRILARAGPFYMVLGYSSIVVSVVYSVLMLGFFLFS